MNHTLGFTYNSDGDVTSKSVTVVGGEGSLNTDAVVPGSTADKLVEMQFATARLKSIYILSDKDLTLETNDGTTPGNTFTITANKPFVWYYGSGITCPFTVDVTAFYFTKSGAGDATLVIRGAKDSTP